ncbi:hypothetical protein PQX77_002077 [Marasmius sp. AFHP31]|nr:hypothetical protein PQX77_002077 [Marasmius sp. AFHP31]
MSLTTPVGIDKSAPQKTPSRSRTATILRKRGSTAADVSITILTALREAADMSGMAPHVGTLCGLALGIVNAAQGASDNRNAFNQLVHDTCSLVYHIRTVCSELNPENEHEELSPMLKSHLQTLTSTLEEIQDFAQRRAGKAFWKLYLSAKSDLDRIKGFRERLRQALDIFGVQSHISVREMVERMDARQKMIQQELETRRSDSDTSVLCQDSERTPRGPSPLVVVPLSSTSIQDPVFTSSPTSLTSPHVNSNPFLGLLSSGNIAGNITFNNVSGNNHVVTNNNSRSITNSRNVYHRTTMRSNNRVYR